MGVCALKDEKLGAAVWLSFVRSDCTHGALRVWYDVLAEGSTAVGLHGIERLMRLISFRARPRRGQLPKDQGERSIIEPNELERAFDAVGPNQKWVADFTCIWTAQGWLYVAVVIDLFSRRVVGWSMKDATTVQMVTDGLMMRRGRPKELLHHPDQGSQYTSEPFQRLTADHGVTCSVSRSDNVWDYAAMESFFSSLKIESVKRKVYRTRDRARADVIDCIERFNNPTHRHSTIGNLSPMQ